MTRLIAIFCGAMNKHSKKPLNEGLFTVLDIAVVLGACYKVPNTFEAAAIVSSISRSV